MSTEDKASTENYETEREYRFTLREFFDQLFYEFQKMSRKNPEGIVNENKVKRLNSVLQPLLEMMKDDAKKGGNYSKIHVALIVGLCYYIAAQKT